MDAIQNLLMGFTVALTPPNLLFAFLGSVLGTLIAPAFKLFRRGKGVLN